MVDPSVEMTILIFLLLLAIFGLTHPRWLDRSIASFDRRPSTENQDRYWSLHRVGRRNLSAGVLGLLIILGLAALVGIGSVLGLALQELSGSQPAPDRWIQTFMVAHRNQWLTSTMQTVTLLGDSSFVIGVVCIVGIIWSYFARSLHPLTLLVVTYLGARVIESAVKQLSHRPRPPIEQAIDHFTRFAFPSGHAIYAITIYGMIAALISMVSRRRQRKLVIWVGATLIVALVGSSRIYLGAHWLTDVVGGYILGVAWLSILLVTIQRSDVVRTKTSQPHVTRQTEYPPLSVMLRHLNRRPPRFRG
jgi:membrane-associated phospholipid phosphatase